MRGPKSAALGSIRIEGVGSVQIAVSRIGLLGIWFGSEAAAQAELSRRGFSVEVDGSSRDRVAFGRIDAIGDAIEREATNPRRIRNIAIDYEGITPFVARVMRAAREIPWGETATYGGLARAVKSPRAARAVGQALGRNPVPLVVPCHRVLSCGGIGGFSGGLALKRRLLSREGLQLS